MPKGVAPGREATTAAVGLRQMIRELELGAANIKGRGEGVLELLRTRDRAEGEIARLRKQGMDLRAEMTRLENVDNIFARKAGLIGHELRPVGGLAGARRSEKPPPEHYWWFGDIVLAEKRRKMAIKSTLIIVGILSLLLVANYVLDKFFGLNPVEKQAHSHTTRAEQYLLGGDHANAIAEYEQAVAILPDEGQPQVQLGVLYDLEGRREEAQAAFAAAEAAIGDHPDYLVTLARAYQMAGELESALTAVEEALEADPDLAMGYMTRGGIYESMGEMQKAAADYERTASLAHEQGNDPLYVIAKVRLGMGLQTGPGVGGPGTGF